MDDESQVPSRSALNRWRNECGMNTAEYAIGTVAACGFAGLLFVCNDAYLEMVHRLLQFAFDEVLWWPPIVR